MAASKRINQGKVDIDYEDTALIVNYEIETIYRDENGRPIDTGNREDNIKADSKRIKLKNLSVEKNLSQLAADIVEKCKYLHSSRVEEIEQLLIKLRKYVIANPPKEEAAAKSASAAGERVDRGERGDRERGERGERERGGDRDRERGERDRGDRERGERERGERERGDRDRGERDKGQVADKPKEEERDPYPEASMRELDDYLEMLYQVSGKSEKEREEGLKLQIRGTAMILKLCRDVMNLEQLIQNCTVMGALTRVLQEEFKKSTDLTFNILRIFLAFSNFVEMHGLMANYRIGMLTVKAIEYEIKRSELREADSREREASQDAEIRDIKSRGLESGELQAQLDKIKRSKEKETVANKRLLRKQDKLLFVAFYILLNLAEDISVERKMIKKNLVDHLSVMLEHGYGDLLVLSTTFLKKLTLFEENKDAMKSINIVNKLTRFIPCSSQQLVTSTLRLLFDLSFDSDIREQIMRCGLVPKLIALLKTPAFRARTLKLLYHLSVDDRCKSMFTYTEGIPSIMFMINNFPQQYLAKELAALAVNLSLNPRNAELMIANKGLNHMMDRLSTTRDPLLLKIIRNISLWTFNLQKETGQGEAQYKFRSLWSPHFKVLLEIVRSVDNHDVLVEALGCLANMTALDLPANATWAKLIRDNNLIALFSRILVPGIAQNDLLLEVVMLLGSIAADAQACELIASSSIIGALYQLWQDKDDDVEIVLQLVHTFHKFFLHETSREEAMYSTRAVSSIIDCLSHRNSNVRAAADAATETILEIDRQPNGDLGLLGIQIRKKRFEGYNMVWLREAGVAFGVGGSTDEGEIVNRGNVYGANGGISHMLDDGDSIVSMGPGGLHDFSDKLGVDEDWHPRVVNGPMGTEYHAGGIGREMYHKEMYDRKSGDGDSDEEAKMDHRDYGGYGRYGARDEFDDGGDGQWGEQSGSGENWG